MNSATGFSSKASASDGAVARLRNDPRGTRHRAQNIAPHTSHEGGTVKRRPSSFRHAVPLLNRCIRGSSPSVDCGFDARRTSHSVAVHRAAGTTIPHSGGHRAREGGSMLYSGISQPLSVTVHPPGSNAADQASWNS